MPVEQGLPWHPVATRLAGQAIPFIVTASHAHTLPSAPFWFPVPAVLVASPALLCPSSLSTVLARVPPGVAPAFCVSMLLLLLSVGAPGCPCPAPPSVPPAYPPPVRGFHISVRRGLSRAQLAGHGPVATPVVGTSRRAGCSPRPCGVRGHLVEGGGPPRASLITEGHSRRGRTFEPTETQGGCFPRQNIVSAFAGPRTQPRRGPVPHPLQPPTHFRGPEQPLHRSSSLKAMWNVWATAQAQILSLHKQATD